MELPVEEGEPATAAPGPSKRMRDTDNEIPRPAKRRGTRNIRASGPSKRSVAGRNTTTEIGDHYAFVPDDVIARRYRTVGLIGQGKTAGIVEATDTQTNKRVAIKIIHPIPQCRDAGELEIKVLQKLKERDPLNRHKCTRLLGRFDHGKHLCMAYELLGMSVYNFLEENNFAPFPRHHIQSLARQLLDSVAFLHGLGVIHTDLKPENILLVHNGSTVKQVTGPGGAREQKVLESTEIRLIDFSSAVFEEERHRNVVSTCYYRAPEIILGLGWSYPCDAFSLGCILVEFYTGVTIFRTLDSLDRLAMMETVLGRMPERLCRSGCRSKPKYFKEGPRLDWPKPKATRRSRKEVRSCRPLAEIIPPMDTFNENFLELVRKLLMFDPTSRITLRDAIAHNYFQLSIPDES